MIKNILRFEANVKGQIGHFLLEHGTEISAAKEMAFQFLKWLGELEDQAKAQEQLQQSEKSPTEEKKSEDLNGNKQ